MRKIERVYLYLALGSVMLMQYQNCGYPVELVPESPSLQLSSLSVPAEGQKVEFRIFIHNRENGLPVKFKYKISKGDFGSSDDFERHEGEILVDQSMTPDQVSAEGILVSLDTVDDNIFEGSDEGFVIEISDETKVFLPVDLNLPLFLVENDKKPTITVTDAIAQEGSDLIFQANLSHPSAFPITFDIVDFGGIPVLGLDFDTNGESFTFNSEETSLTFTISTRIDSIFETNSENGVFSVVTNDLADVLSKDVSFAITDNTPPPTIQASDEVVTEGEDIVFQITLSSTVDTDISFDYVVNPVGTGFKTTDLKSASELSGTIFFAKGDSQAQVVVRTRDDNILEDGNLETLELILQNVPSFLTTIAGLGGTTNFTAKINDNDTAILEVENITVNEDSPGSVDVTVKSNIPTAIPITFKAKTQNGTAIAPGDFVAVVEGGVGQPFTIAPNELTPPSQVVSIIINNDTIYENGGGDETFQLEISSPTPTPEVQLSPTRKAGTITVVDDDPEPELTLTSADSVQESLGQLNVNLTLNRQSSSPASVRLKTRDGSAIAVDGDYTAFDQIITFAPGETTQNVQILISNDGEFEVSENFNLELSAGTGLNIVSPNKTITIINTTAQPQIELSSLDNFSIQEGDSGSKNIRFRMTRLTATSLDVSFRIKTIDGTGPFEAAKSSSDYSSQNKTITIPPGLTFKDFTIPITTDKVFELDEKFKLEISEITGASLKNPSNVFELTIQNDDIIAVKTLNFGGGGATITEGDSNSEHEPKITFTHDSEHDLEFTYSTTTIGQTATSGLDFIAPAVQVITLNAGDKSISLPAIPVIDDNIIEQVTNETYKVNITNIVVKDYTGSNPPTISDAFVVATIEDNDSPDLAFVESTTNFGLTLNSGDGVSPVSGSLTVVLDKNNPLTTTEVPMSFDLVDFNSSLSLSSLTSTSTANKLKEATASQYTFNSTGIIPAGQSSTTITFTMNPLTNSDNLDCNSSRIAKVGLKKGTFTFDSTHVEMLDQRLFNLVQIGTTNFNESGNFFEVTLNVLPQTTNFSTRNKEFDIEFSAQNDISFTTVSDTLILDYNVNQVVVKVTNVNITDEDDAAINFNVSNQNICSTNTQNYSNSTSKHTTVAP